MGTKQMQHRRNRRGRTRGFAPFVAFALLFAFALGQGSSLVAFAFDNSGAGTAVSNAGGAPAADDSADDGSTKAGSDGGSATGVSSSDSGSTSTGGAGKVSTAGKGGDAAAPAAAQQLDGGDIDLDYVAAGPFTYNHNTGLGSPPQFGYDNRQISKTNGVVESLEAGDFECGDYVTFFTQVVVAKDAAGSGTVELDYSFGTETTGQPGLGFVDIISAAINIPDGGNVGNVGDNVVTLSNEFTETQGYDELHGTVTVTNLAPGEEAIVRVIVELGCLVGSSPTGNILTAIDAARADGDTVPVGQQTVPMKKVEDIAQPGLDVNKTCPADAGIGDTIAYEIEIVNTGNEALDILSVMDTVNGHPADDITDLFPASVAAGATVSADYEYTVLASDPDPLPNSVSVSAEGAISGATLTGSASCETDVTHVPGIDVTKSCPAEVAVGEDIEYTITVENTGNEPLVGVTVEDTLLGDITGDFDFDFSQPFPAGEVATALVTYQQQAGDPDPITNTVTATGTGADSGAEATDTASCTTNITHVPGIAVTKSCPVEAGEGDTITYSITVSNTGNEALEDVTVMDSVLGDLSDSFGDTLDVGDSETQEFDYTVPEDGEDPLVNVVAVSGSGVDSGTTVTSTATCSTDILHPAISIVKTVSEETVAVGDTVTYTYVVKNTGDTTLFDISVDDDVLGHIGDIDVLEPGDSATLTKDFVVGDEVVRNIAIARGHDILGRVVEASDDAIVTPILGTSPTPTPPTTPFTGSDAGWLGLIAALAIGVGLTVIAATRRGRSGETT
jgi:uncharacterized repeat protein (TIGR01451 family)